MTRTAISPRLAMRMRVPAMCPEIIGPPVGPVSELGQDSLEEVVRAERIDVPPRFLETTSSTNSEALTLAEAGAPEWTIVAAGHQTGGRGRLGRGWFSVPGKSLMFSTLLRPPLPAEEAPLVSILAATKMTEAVREVAAIDATAKWPNDLVVGERKLGGVLAEAKISEGKVEHLVIGIGVNVSMEEEDFLEELRGTATSVAIEGGVADPVGILESFLRRFRHTYRPEEAGFGNHVSTYSRHCSTLGRMVRATTVAGETVEGRAVLIDDRGGLIVERDGERVTVAFGEVAHLD
jgi:BirA family biotin operon repressor/biotin-[acetyl-CoA-carboxylase] ligase